MPRKSKKINDMELIHGKQKPNPITMDEVWGIHENIYKQDNIQDYTSYIKSLNQIDLFAHAAKAGIKPSNANRSLTEKKLIKAFAEYTSARRTPPAPKEHIKDKKAAQERISKILRGY